MLAEEIRPVAFTGTATAPTWLDEAEVEAALASPPVANVVPSIARDAVAEAIASLPDLGPELDRIAHARAEALLDAHTRVRTSARAGGTIVSEPVLPVDVLGVFVLLPHVRLD